MRGAAAKNSPKISIEKLIFRVWDRLGD